MQQSLHAALRTEFFLEISAVNAACEEWLDHPLLRETA